MPRSPGGEPLPGGLRAACCEGRGKAEQAGLKDNAEKLLGILEKNPYQNPPPYEKLVGDLAGCYSRRINLQHRQPPYEEERVVKVLGCGLTMSERGGGAAPAFTS